MSEIKRPGRKPMFATEDERRAYRREYKRRWDAAHPDKQKEYSQKYHKAHPQKLAEAGREYRRNNPDYWVRPAISRLKRSGYTILLNGKEV